MIGFLGAGRVGAQAALEVASQSVADVTLVDIVPGLAEGEALDITHRLSDDGVDVKVTGSTDFASLRGAQVVVVTAGVARKPGMTRMDLLGRNAGIVGSVAKEVAKHAGEAVVITVTNPVDVMNYLVWRVTGFPRERVVGMGGLLDLSRLKSTLASRLRVSRSSISSLVVGEHGESMLPLSRYTSVGGVPLESMLTDEQFEQVIERTRQVAAEVISKKGATVFAPANAIARMATAVALDRKEVVPASAVLEGEYGLKGLSIGVPVMLGRRGVERIFELELQKRERTHFMKGASTIRRAISSLPR
jgi:malate dehydrogenase